MNDLSCQTNVQIYLLCVFLQCMKPKYTKPHNPTQIPKSCLEICKASKLRGKGK